jgi:NhaA family Na+:H+ antiporter
LLIGDLAFAAGSAADQHVKIGILTGSLGAALLAGVLVKSRDRTYRRIEAAVTADEDGDGVPDVYQPPRSPRGE